MVTVRNGSRDDLGLSWGVVGTQGWRPAMEDRFVADANLESHGLGEIGIFGVFDGHGGAQVSEMCAGELPKAIARGRSATGHHGVSTSFLEVDRMIGQKDLDHVGCTAIVSLIDKQKILVANVGDSRAVLSHEGRATALSTYHKPNMAPERKRIYKAGGSVSEQRDCFRVNGDLAVSRAMGDFRLKRNPQLGEEEQLVSCVPEIETHTRCPEDEFMIIATDSVWNIMSNQAAVDLVHMYLPQIKDGSLQPADVVYNILDECLASESSAQVGTDNMTMILLIFEEPRCVQPNCVRTAPLRWVLDCFNHTAVSRPEPARANVSAPIPRFVPISSSTPGPTTAPSQAPAPASVQAPSPVPIQAPTRNKSREDWAVGSKIEIRRSSGTWTQGEVLLVDHEKNQLRIAIEGTSKIMPFAHCTGSNIRLLAQPAVV